jgi:hypothetical protein
VLTDFGIKIKFSIYIKLYTMTSSNCNLYQPGSLPENIKDLFIISKIDPSIMYNGQMCTVYPDKTGIICLGLDSGKKNNTNRIYWSSM